MPGQNPFIEDAVVISEELNKQKVDLDFDQIAEAAKHKLSDLLSEETSAEVEEVWQPYTGQREKKIYDVKLKDGTIQELMYPNGGGWGVMVKLTKAYHDVRDEDVVEIKLRPDGWREISDCYKKESESILSQGRNSGLADLYNMMYALASGLNHMSLPALSNSSSRNNDTYGSRHAHSMSVNTWNSITKNRPTTKRNDLCTCGSGKKFKHCCLGKWESENLVEKK